MNYKKLIMFFLMLLMAVNINAQNVNMANTFDSIPDETILASVGKNNITMYDLKVYLAGYKTVHSWTMQAFDNILTSLMLDLLFLSACEEEGIKVPEEEVGLYAEDFFLSRSIDINNSEEILSYFNTHDPYYDIEDFLLKTQYFLLKVKYLATHDAIETYKTSMIYLSTQKMKKEQIAAVYKQAMQITNDLYYGKITFADAVAQYSQDAETKATKGKIFSEVTKQHKLKKDFAKKNFQKIFNAGLFSPILIEGKDGYYIIMNTDCRFDDNGKMCEKITDELKKKYLFERKVFFQEMK